MDLIGAAGKIISLIEGGIQVSDQLKEIAKSEHKLPNNVESLYNNVQQLLEITKELPLNIGSSGSDRNIRDLADRAKNISNRVIDIMDKINPDWRKRRYTPITLWRSFLKQQDVELIRKDFINLQDRMKNAMLDLVCQSNSKFKSQFEELRDTIIFGSETVVKVQGSIHDLGQRLDSVQDSIYNLGKQVGLASLAEEEFQRQAAQLLILERKLSTILRRLSVGFQEKDLKANAIANADPGTFGWMTQGSENCEAYPEDLNEEEKLAYDSCDPDMSANHAEASKNFRLFLQESSGAFLILGKPGSGKSTLMKYLMHNSLVLQNLERWAASMDKKLIRAFFFFSVTQGSGTLSSEESLYRTLLFQILRECPTLLDEVLPGEAELSPSMPIPFGAVQDAIRCLFSDKSKVAENYCFSIFIDGLDEFRLKFSDPKRGIEQNNYDISQLTYTLMRWCQNKDSSSRIYTKMIFSSRVIPALDSLFDSQQIIYLHRHTKRDIIRSAFSTFKKYPGAPPQSYVELSETICNRAQGVFIWAHFVIKDILEAYTDGVESDKFRDRIEKMPRDISDLYVQILGRVKEQDREESAMILRLAAFQPEGFSLNVLTYTWLDKFKDPKFPFNVAARVYSASERNQQRSRAVQRLAALTHGLLEDQYTQYIVLTEDLEFSHDGDLAPFFETDIVFVHRTAQDFVRSLLNRDSKDAKDGSLPWVQGDYDVSEDNWPHNWRSNLYVRIFLTGMRFGIPRSDDHGKPHNDLCDFGFWSDDPEQFQLPHFKSLSEFSRFSNDQKSFYLHYPSGAFWQEGVQSGRYYGGGAKLPKRYTLNFALREGEDISSIIKSRRLSRKLSSQLALTYGSKHGNGSMSLDVLKWLLENNHTCATDKIPVWHMKDAVKIEREISKAIRADQGHINDECSCGALDGPYLQEHSRPVQIWLLFLRQFGVGVCHAALEARISDRNPFERYCQMLELWLQYGATVDAIVIITFDMETQERYEFGTLKDMDIFYVEIEQLLHLAGKPRNFEKLQYLLAGRHQSWGSWLAHGVQWMRDYLFRVVEKTDSGSVSPIRSRYPHVSNHELSQREWRVCGVLSDDSEVLGDFSYIVGS